MQKREKHMFSVFRFIVLLVLRGRRRPQAVQGQPQPGLEGLQSPGSGGQRGFPAGDVLNKTRTNFFNDLRGRIKKEQKITKSWWQKQGEVAYLILWFQSGVWPPFLITRGSHPILKSYWENPITGPGRRWFISQYDFRTGCDLPPSLKGTEGVTPKKEIRRGTQTTWTSHLNLTLWFQNRVWHPLSQRYIGGHTQKWN